MATTKKSTAKKRKPAAKKPTKAQLQAKRELNAIILFALGVLLLLLAAIPGDNAWNTVHNVLRGLMGWCCYLMGPLMMIVAVLLTMDRTAITPGLKSASVVLMVLLLCGITHIIGGSAAEGTFAESIKALYRGGTVLTGGGACAILFGVYPLRWLGRTGALIVDILLFFVFFMISTGTTLIGLFRGAAKPVKKLEEAYTAAVENLQRAYSLAAGEGRARLMMLSRAYIGNCYCNQLDVENMEAHYTVAERLATALHDAGMLASIRYNRAATALETGDYESAYRYFSALEEPTAMALHKLAICCEKLGRRDEAFSALNRAAAVEDTHMPAGLAEEMLSLVRRRLENPDYLRDADYGAALLDCFERCRRELPIGYAGFHLPWLLEWYTANRQYKLAYELMNEFPIKLKI